MLENTCKPLEHVGRVFMFGFKKLETYREDHSAARRDRFQNERVMVSGLEWDQTFGSLSDFSDRTQIF